MRLHRIVSALVAAGFVLLAAAPGTSQEVAKRTAKRAAKEATESAAKEKAEEAAKKAIKKAAAPDAIDLNSATPEQLAKLGLDEPTAQKIVAARPFTSLDDPKIKDVIPADALAKLGGKITVKGPAETEKPGDADKAPSEMEKPPTDAAKPPSR